MGIYDKATAKLKDAFDDQLADAVENFRHYPINPQPGDYDPAIGIPSRVIYDYVTRGVFLNYTKEEIESGNVRSPSLTTSIAILPTDVKLLALQDEVVTQPEPDDRILRIETNKSFKVVAVSEDPAKVTYTMQIRSSADAQ